MRLSFSVRDQDVNVLDNSPPLTVLQSELERIIGNLKGSTFCETKANLCHVTNRRNRLDKKTLNKIEKLRFGDLVRVYCLDASEAMGRTGGRRRTTL